MNNYYDNNYNYNQQPKKPQNNTALIAVLAILCTVVIAVLIVGALFLTGAVNLSGGTATGSDISVITEPQPEPVKPVETTMYVANVNYSIYFRSAPVENDSNIICEILYGTPVIHIEAADAVFAKIRYNGQEGYVKSEYLSSTVPPAKPAQPSAYDGDTTVKYNVYVANVENSIYLRSQPNESDDNIITTIPLGTAVGYIETTNGTFSKIKYGNTVGYSKSIYLSGSRPSSGSRYMTVYNVKNSIYLRRRPSSDEGSNIICEIPVGSVVEYISDAGNGYYKIRWNGTTGYGTAKYLR